MSMYVNTTYRRGEVSVFALYLAACHTPEAATTVLSAPEDGRKKRPKHVEHYCSY